MLTYITVMDYNINGVYVYVIEGEVADGEQWITKNTDHQLDEIHWMMNDCMPEVKVDSVD